FMTRTAPTSIYTLSLHDALPIFAGCGGQKGDSSQKSADDGSIEFWTFVEMHGTFYENMAEKWNKEHPDKQIKLNVNVMPFDDMQDRKSTRLNSSHVSISYAVFCL